MTKETKLKVQIEFQALQSEFLEHSAKYHKAVAALLERMRVIVDLIEREYKP